MRTILRILLLLSLPVIGALVGYAISAAVIDGRFESWQPLGTPPEPVTTLVAGESGPWTLGQTGQWYLWPIRGRCDQPAGCWQLVDPPLVADTGEYDPQIPVEICGSPPPLGEVQASAMRCDDFGLHQELNVYALRPDGTVWRWSHAADLGVGPLLTRVGFAGAGGAAGLVLMLFVLLGRFARQLLRPARPSS
jgi:hypothetical protein